MKDMVGNLGLNLVAGARFVVEVYIKAYGVLGDYVREGRYTFKEGVTVREVVETLVPLEVRRRFSIVVFVNDEPAPESRVVYNGDRVVLLPPSSGG